MVNRDKRKNKRMRDSRAKELLLKFQLDILKNNPESVANL